MGKASSCSNCGRPVAPNQNFCGGCGVSVMAESDPTDPYVGRLVDGKYLIERLVGTGAMGVVYGAKHVTLNKQVALKILRRSLVGDTTVARRFKQEARAASRFNHPNTIQILDFGELPDLGLYMAMEFIEGRDLGKLIQHDLPLAAERIVHITVQVLSALEEAHGEGVLHRDVKPANIVVADLRSQRDFVKVLDFGIAKIMDADPDESVPVTRDGFVCGTPAFMSPEQVQGLKLGPGTDLFSLGVVLYQILTGSLPFKADSPVEMATKIILEKPVPPSQACTTWPVHPGLEAVVIKALAKKPAERYGSAGEMIADLHAVLEELRAAGARVGTTPAPLATPVPPRPRRVITPLPRPGATPLPAHASGQARELAGLPSVGSRSTSPAPTGDRLPNRPIGRAATGGAPASRVPRSPSPASAGVRSYDGTPAPESCEASAVDLSWASGEAARAPSPDQRGPAPGPSTGELLAAAGGGRRWPAVAIAVLGFVALGLAGLATGRLVGQALQVGSHAQPGDGSAPPASAADAAMLAASAATPDGDMPRASAPDVGPGEAARSDAGGTSARPARTRPTRGRGRRRTARRPRRARPAAPKPTAAERARELHREGLRLMRQRDLDGALARLAQARRLAPGMAVLHRDMGRIAMRRGQRDAAVGHFRRYLQAAPNASDAVTYRTIIESLKGS